VVADVACAGIVAVAAERTLVATEPIGGLGQPNEIGAAVAWLRSHNASFVTGVALPIDGCLVAQQVVRFAVGVRTLGSSAAERRHRSNVGVV
jgi:hypothetical protein